MAAAEEARKRLDSAGAQATYASSTYPRDFLKARVLAPVSRRIRVRHDEFILVDDRSGVATALKRTNGRRMYSTCRARADPPSFTDRASRCHRNTATTRTSAGSRCSECLAERMQKRGPYTEVQIRVFFLRASSCCLRLATVTWPNFLVKRSMRPSVSTSFWRPVKKGWQLEQISRCNSGFVERVVHDAPQVQRASTS